MIDILEFMDAKVASVAAREALASMDAKEAFLAADAAEESAVTDTEDNPPPVPDAVVLKTAPGAGMT
jgi:hypothetical protein